MKKRLVLLIVPLIVLLGVSLSWSYTYSLYSSDIWGGGLDHGAYFSWGIDWLRPETEIITSASLTYYGISDIEPSNVLYSTLLDSAASGLRQYNDAGASGNNVPGGTAYVLLDSWNAPSTPVNHAIIFTPEQLSAMNWFASTQAPGMAPFGIAIDPDCHYTFNRIDLTVNTTPASVPEPQTMFLLGCGLVVVARFARKKINKV